MKFWDKEPKDEDDYHDIFREQIKKAIVEGWEKWHRKIWKTSWKLAYSDSVLNLQESGLDLKVQRYNEQLLKDHSPVSFLGHEIYYDLKSMFNDFRAQRAREHYLYALTSVLVGTLACQIPQNPIEGRMPEYLKKALTDLYSSPQEESENQIESDDQKNDRPRSIV